MESRKNTPSPTAPQTGATKRSPWAWVPSLYFAEGVPYVIIMTLSVIMYHDLGLSDKEAAFYTSWLYLPWVIKPFWSPIIDTLRTKRWWILTMQFFIGAGLAGVAFTLPMNHYLQWSLALFYLMAFSSATHDIAADGFYMLGLDEHEQSLFVGIRSTFYRIATIAAQGGLLVLVEQTAKHTHSIVTAWSYILVFTAVLFIALGAYHNFMLPKPSEDGEQREGSVGEVFRAFKTFFLKPQALTAIAFLLLFRLPEALIAKICPLFLLADADKGGLGLTNEQVGIAQGTVGIIGLTLGGILGGIAASRGGFKKWLWPMVLAITLPDCVYLVLSYFLPTSLTFTSICLGIEQFGYGFGFTAYMLFMLYFAQGESKTAHYAFCTGFMALSMMLPGLVAGWLSTQLGYFNYFALVMALVPVTFLAAAIIKVPADFGMKKE